MGYMEVVDIVKIRGNIGTCEKLLSYARHTKSYYRWGGPVVSQNKRTQYRPQNTIIVFMGTPQKGPLIVIDPPYHCSVGFASSLEVPSLSRLLRGFW